jgi:hypothetical protein
MVRSSLCSSGKARHALATPIRKAKQRQDQPGAPIQAVMERPLVPTHLITLEGEAPLGRVFGRRWRDRLREFVAVAADRDDSCVDEPDYLFLVEVDNRIEPLDRPSPQIGSAARRIETGYLEKAAALLCRVGEITGREGRAKEVLEGGVAAISHCRLPFGVGACDLLSILPFFG